MIHRRLLLLLLLLLHLCIALSKHGLLLFRYLLQREPCCRDVVGLLRCHSRCRLLHVRLLLLLLLLH